MTTQDTDEKVTVGAEEALSSKALAAGVITIARFLAKTDPTFLAYLHDSLFRATQAGLAPDDLTFLTLLTRAVG